MTGFYGRDWPEAPDVDPWGDDPAARGAEPARSRLTPGGTFILDAPDHVPAIWGDGTAVVWAEGESLILAGPPGVGKTTVAGQVLRARLAGGEVLGLPVAPTGSRVLYLAMDRPRQIARALRRMLGDLPREVLDERLVVWQGPPLADIARHPETLLGLAQLAGADTVVVDSLKDAAVGLTDDETGAGYNRARQYCLAAGVEVLELHHVVKRGQNGATPTTLADVYGSAWITAGAGSVVLLWGEAGDPIVSWRHLKQPASEVGPWRIAHDHDAGHSVVYHAADLLTVARLKGEAGLTAKEAAVAIFEKSKPSSAEVEKARRRLDRLVDSGELARQDGDRGTAAPAVWTFTNTFTRREATVTLHADDDPSRSVLTDTFTQPSRPSRGRTFTNVTPPVRGGREGPGSAAEPTTPSNPVPSPSTDDPRCSVCGRRLGRSEQGPGVCLPCQRVAASSAS